MMGQIKRRILVVDDEPDILFLVKRTLEKEGYDVLTASSGRECLEILEDTVPDLILMDIMMEGMDGIETAQAVRERFHIPVIYLTAYDDDMVLDRAKMTAPYGYLIKPFQQREIYAAIEVALYKHRIEEEIMAEQERFRAVFEHAPSGIALMEADGRFFKVNRALQEILGYTEDELLNMTLVDITHPSDTEKNLRLFREMVGGGRDSYQVLGRCYRKDGRVIWADLRVSAVRDARGNYQYNFVMVQDVTERKEAEEEMRRGLMRFRLEEGGLYLVKEPHLGMSLEAFRDLLRVGYHGVVLSRSPEEEMRRIVDGDFQHKWLAEKGGRGALSPEVEEVETWIEALPERTSILLDRLDYLVLKNGFQKTLSFVQRLREIAYLKDYIVIMSLDPSTLDGQALGLLEKETREVEPLHRVRMDDDLLEVLRFIYKETNMGKRPSFTDVGRDLGISRPTARKRIKRLIQEGYVRESVRGNRKVLDLTGEGVRLFLD
jgi:PAS domain S-box-containing protein